MGMQRYLRWTVVSAIAAVVGAGTALGAAGFLFSYVSTWGSGGLSHPYAGPTSTGQSYGSGVAISSSDASQKVYTLVEANANVGVGGCRGCFPASSRTVPPNPATAAYLGPYYIVRRTSSGAIDSTFGANGYVDTFNASDTKGYQFTSICVDPGTDDIIVIGQTTASGTAEAIVERLKQPRRGSGIAVLDSSFNAGGVTPGVVTLATPGGKNNPSLSSCAVSNQGIGHRGTVYAAGIDDATSSSLVLAAKITGAGSLDGSFGSNGIAEFTVTGVNPSAEVTNVSINGQQSNFPDLILAGYTLTKGTRAGTAALPAAMVVAVNRCTGTLDTNFNGTGELVNSNYGEAVLGRIAERGGTAADLYVLYATANIYNADFVDYAIRGVVPDTSSPTSQTGILSVPSDFASAQGYTLNSSGRIVVSGNTSSSAELLAEIGGAGVLGYSPDDRWQGESQSDDCPTSQPHGHRRSESQH
jgi:hypothetical protein